jgi:hypothetical protein
MGSLVEWLENSGFAIWVREGAAFWAYDVFLASHAVGMAAVVGLSTAVALRVLGVAPHLPLAPMEKLLPFAYAGFWVNATSGVALFAAYPTKALTNPGFYIKMGAVVASVVTLIRLRHAVFGKRAPNEAVSRNAKGLARALLLSWWVAILAGRLLAYHDIANVERTTIVAVTAVSAFLLLTIYAAGRRRRKTKAVAADSPQGAAI